MLCLCQCKWNDSRCIAYICICCSLYDVDGNGWIDIDEMTRIVRSIYKMMGPTQGDSAEKKAEEVFNQMDANKDGRLTRQEFVSSCMNDSKLAQLLSPR